jgi:mannosyl-3-phosphoglycerate phosphatase
MGEVNEDRPKLVIFADLDGTILSEKTYEPGPAQEALNLCRGMRIPVIFVSSKTRAEIESIRRELINSEPFIPENGGAVFLPRKDWSRPAGWMATDHYWYLALGKPHHILCRALKEAAASAGAKVMGFSDMPENRLAALTGLSEKAARLAKIREFDEPFIVLNENQEILSSLKHKISAQGFLYTRGGMFHHITGGCNKGEAVRLLIALYRKLSPGVRFAAIGDAVNDLPMLREVNYPFLTRKADSTIEQTAHFAGVTVTEGIGPQGFSEAIEYLRKLTF